MTETVNEVVENDKLSRRSFLSIAIWAIGGLISAALGIPAIAYIIGPALQRSNDQQWIQLGSTAKVELGTPTLFKANIVMNMLKMESFITSELHEFVSVV